MLSGAVEDNPKKREVADVSVFLTAPWKKAKREGRASGIVASSTTLPYTNEDREIKARRPEITHRQTIFCHLRSHNTLLQPLIAATARDELTEVCSQNMHQSSINISIDPFHP